jgi:periplasmic protein TonB
MQNHQEVPATLEEIVFQNRNKSYGAYSLRIDYQNIIKKSLLIGISIFGLAVLTPMLWAKVERNQKVIVTATVLDLVEPPKEVIKPIEPITPPPPKVEEVKVKMIDFSNLEIIDTDEEMPPIPDQDLLNNTDAKIGDKTQDGEVMEVPVDDPDAVKGKEIDMPVAVEAEDKNQVFITVEQNPEFAGGMNALLKFLQKNLHYPTPAVNANVMGKVYMQFVVGQDGNISKVDVLKGIGFGCDEEAQRVVKLMPKWSPGRQSGRAVAVKFTLPISFQLAE